MRPFPILAILWTLGLAAHAQQAADTRDGHVYLSKADGSGMKALPDLPGFDMQGSPCWSADGRLLCFDAWRPGEIYTKAQIVVVNADGSNPRILCDGAMPNFSPQARRIAFSRYAPNQGVWVMSVEGPDKELVLLDEQGWSAEWSPTGREIVYAVNTSRGANLAKFDLIEGVTTQLFEDDNAPYQNVFHNFVWSPDGREIVFRGQGTDGKVEMAIVDSRGAKHGLRRIEVAATANFAWFPDGSRLLFTQSCRERGGRQQIYSLNPQTKDPPRLLPGQDPDRTNTAVAVSPDGSQLVICSNRPPKKAAEK